MELIASIDSVVANEGSAVARWKMSSWITCTINVVTCFVFPNLTFIFDRIIWNILSSKEPFRLNSETQSEKVRMRISSTVFHRTTLTSATAVKAMRLKSAIVSSASHFMTEVFVFREVNSISFTTMFRKRDLNGC